MFCHAIRRIAGIVLIFRRLIQFDFKETGFVRTEEVTVPGGKASRVQSPVPPIHALFPKLNGNILSRSSTLPSCGDFFVTFNCYPAALIATVNPSQFNPRSHPWIRCQTSQTATSSPVPYCSGKSSSERH